ncbi:phage scaffolding protein [Salipaludibacillus agaradhaerens]|uniref:Phage scaffolding protein n=1 Tax=Salipaludibacillus agaradhaerens TaxID=76935 RepID=A0A9Q4B2D3_SALAG|nr:phage scaffolding protein [Salipaludibacillus agaradhaerens]MCR6096860.1 phage scaffolding protein [Salipaludibacillus agaradhaerens]MCR6116704.1 phage scaffolding protein [Salipaludibacillus agaradhaerens]
MKRAFLTDLGIDTEVVDKIMKEHGKAVNELKEENEKVEQYKEQLEEKDKQLKDRDTQLEELSKKAKGSEELTEEIEKLKEANEKTTKEYEDKLSKQAFEHELEKDLKKAKAKNPTAVKALLDLEKIKLDGDKLIGLEDQLGPIKETDDYLFGDEEPPGLKGRTPHTPKSGEPKGVTKEDFKNMSYTDRVELKNSNPELYQTLKG